MIELVPYSAHPIHNPNGKSVGSAVFAQFTAVSSGTLAPPGEYHRNCAHWRHLANTIELMFPQPKWQINRFSRL